MSEHSLPAGKRLIRGLSKLGEAMGYDVRPEFPVVGAASGHPMAVDVAWFGDSTQPYPLMIFEVETRAGNTIANNPLKVFGQESKHFEKPLFFFQIILTGTGDANRVALLERQFGSHNYRVYRLSRDEGRALLQDILRQHRRIRHDLNRAEVYKVLSSGEWSEVVEPTVALDEADSLRLAPDRSFPDAIHLARSYERVAARLPQLVERSYESAWDVGEPTTYIGGSWTPALLMAWMIGSEPQEDAQLWDARLVEWQNTNSHVPMLCSHLGLSYDYTQFLLGLGGPFVALLVGLSRAKGEAGRVFLSVLLETLERVGPAWHGLQVALWACHISARLDVPDGFEKARRFVNEVGGVAPSDLAEPPSILSIDDLGEAEQFSRDPKVECPPMDLFVQRIIKASTFPRANRTACLLRVLDDDAAVYDWSNDILPLLWNSTTG
jgi:hypothetical protein